MDNIYIRSLRIILKLLSLVTNVDLHGRIRTNRMRRAKVVMIVVNLIYFYCLIKLSLCCYYSYSHSFKRYSLERYLVKQSIFSWSSKEAKNGQQQNTTLEFNALFNEFKSARERIKSIGAPHLDFNFVAEANYLCTIIYSLYVRVILPLYFHYRNPMSSDLISVLMARNEKAAREICCTNVQLELDRLIPLDHSSSISLRNTSFGYYIRSPELFAASYPFNRRPEWLTRLSKTFCLCFVVLVPFCALCAALFTLFPLDETMLLGYKFRWSPKDLTMLVEILIFLLLTCLGGLFLFTTACLTSIDQLVTLHKLIKSIRKCGQVNEARFDQLATMEAKIMMNKHLLQAFIQYRMFVRQARMTLTQQAVFIIALINVVAIGPLIILLQANYMKPELLIVQDMAYVLVALLTALLWAPICYTQARCQTLYRSLYSLMAHIALVQQQRANTYSWHLVSLLSKELSDPHKLLDRLTVKKFGYKFAYTNYLRYYWYVILLLICGNNTHLLKGGNTMIGRLTTTL